MTREEAFADLKRTMSKETEDIVYRCNDCSKYNLCRYYHRRKETSQICHYFALEERKTGKWEIITDFYPHNVYCSVCHKRYAQTHWSVWNDKDFPLPRNYCPNCGARMEVDNGKL